MDDNTKLLLLSVMLFYPKCSNSVKTKLSRHVCTCVPPNGTLACVYLTGRTPLEVFIGHTGKQRN